MTNVAQTAFDIGEQQRHFLEEFPPKHEMVEGKLISPKLARMEEVPVPPQWVRNQVKVPQNCEWATLAKKVAHFYPPAVREVLVEYVLNWRVNQRLGASVLIAGRAPYNERAWAAAAVMNEIVMRYSVFGNISTAWVNMSGMQRILQMQEQRDSDYSGMWERIKNVALLLIIDPMRIKREVKSPHLEVIYEDRLLKRLPTITTFTTPIVDDDWSEVEKNLGEFITEAIQEPTKGYVAHY